MDVTTKKKYMIQWIKYIKDTPYLSEKLIREIMTTYPSTFDEMIKNFITISEKRYFMKKCCNECKKVCAIFEYNGKPVQNKNGELMETLFPPIPVIKCQCGFHFYDKKNKCLILFNYDIDEWQDKINDYLENN